MKSEVPSPRSKSQLRRCCSSSRLDCTCCAQGRGGAPAGGRAGAAAPAAPRTRRHSIIPATGWPSSRKTGAGGWSRRPRATFQHPVERRGAAASRKRGTRRRTKRPAKQCRAYGAPGLMRGPTRLHITWQDDKTLKIETDYGTQTRLLALRRRARRHRARKPGRASRPRSGSCGRRRPRPRRASAHGSIKSVTTQTAAWLPAEKRRAL